jgi:hypothetical protein
MNRQLMHVAREIGELHNRPHANEHPSQGTDDSSALIRTRVDRARSSNRVIYPLGYRACLCLTLIEDR